MSHFNNNLNIFLINISVLLFCACSSNGLSNNVSSKTALNQDMQIINKYSSEYFVGMGVGNASTENIAMKIARANALGELSANVKVFIVSKLEVFSSEDNSGKANESVSQQIIEIGNATIRSPEYEIISSKKNTKSDYFEVKILAKKLRSAHFEEASNSIQLEDSSELLRFLNK